jgi:hypothetical protein
MYSNSRAATYQYLHTIVTHYQYLQHPHAINTCSTRTL